MEASLIIDDLTTRIEELESDLKKAIAAKEMYLNLLEKREEALEAIYKIALNKWFD